MKLPQDLPNDDEILRGLAPERLSHVIGHMAGPTHEGRYLHWDEVRRRTPPADLSTEEWWLLLKWARRSGRRSLPFVDVEAKPFVYILTDEALSMLHRVDKLASGQIEAPDVITNRVTRDRYVISGLMEEAISSSLLEGAATTRKEAKQMLRSGRAPRNRGEQMVLNNYRTMQFIRQDLDKPLTFEMILEIHRMVTEDTLDDPDDAGRIQTPGERRVDIGDPFDQEVVFHVPPPAEDLPALMERLVEFANDVDGEPFVHPVVRAIALHFYLAYIHPFVDGNGRTARALFYRSMLRQGYWLTEFISISRLLTNAPVKYGRAFLNTETDGADFTYFLLHQLDVICRAIDDLMAYLDRRLDEVSSVEIALRGSGDLNHRQLALLTNAIRRPDAIYTFETHRRSHDVTYQTARADLLDLEALGFLNRSKAGRQYRFHPVRNLEDLIAEREAGS